MITLIAMITCGMVAGLGLTLLLATLLTPMSRLEPALDRLAPHRYLHSSPITAPSAPTDTTEKIGAWLTPRLANRTGFTPPDRELSLLGMTRDRYYGEKAVFAFTGLLTPAIAGSVQELLGFGLGYAIPAGVSLLIAVVCWFLPDLQIRDKARAARHDFMLAVVAYLQLVAILRRAGRGPANALSEAASLSESWTFTRIRTELYRAQLASVPPWDALDTLGDDLEVSALQDVATIMRSAGESGAGVYDALIARANSLRTRSLAADQGRSQTATSAMHIPVTVMALVFVAALILPATLAVL